MSELPQELRATYRELSRFLRDLQHIVAIYPDLDIIRIEFTRRGLRIRLVDILHHIDSYEESEAPVRYMFHGLRELILFMEPGLQTRGRLPAFLAIIDSLQS